MAFATFADPSAAIEPPPQPWEFDLSMASAVLADPFAAINDYGGNAPAPAPADSSWTDIVKKLGQDFVQDLAGQVSGKVTGYNPSDPASVARLAASQEAQRKADQQKVFWIVGGVGAAVLVGALLLRKKAR
jgi:hypothetical protein